MKLSRLIPAASLLALLLTAGCGSMGGILGPSNDPSGYPSSGRSSSRIEGTVRNIDARSQAIEVTIYSADGRSVNDTTTVYYDSRTRLTYRNQSGDPANLERGDRIALQVSDRGNGQYVADTIDVVQSVSDQSRGTYPNSSRDPYPSGSTYPDSSSSTSNGQIRGTISNIDTRARRIDVTAAYGNNLNRSQERSYTVYYDDRTRVWYQNVSHSPEDLERGDEVDIRIVDSRGQQIADTINVVRDVRR